MRQLTQNAETSVRVRALVNTAAGPSITVLLSIAAMGQALKIWQWRPGDPINLSGDSAWLLAGLKDMLNHGWNGVNYDLGAPYHQDPSWFPHADHLHLLLVKVIGLFSDSPFTVSAIYFFLGFPMAALTMYWLARQRHLSRPGSVVAGVLFSIIPGHQTMFQHLWLASYWVVPLGVWLVLRVAMGESLFRPKVDWREPVARRRALPLNLTTAFCVLCIATGGIYYAAFTLLLLAVTLLLRLVATRDLRSVARAAVLLVSIGSLSLVAVLSVAAGQDKSTLVTTPAQRGFWESELYAGKLMDLILPWIDHRMSALKFLTVTYNSRTTPSPEEPALGVVALCGVVALVVMILSSMVPHRVKPLCPELGMLGALSVAAISFFSIGGLGSFVGLFVTPQIRTWSRLFVVIASFGLLAIGYWVSVISRRNRGLGLLVATGLLVVGVLDQTNPAMAPRYAELRSEVAGLRTFNHRLEARVPPRCPVFQLPIATFPNNTRVQNMESYAHFRPYFSSSSLRWSYGAFDGTSLADWQLALPQKSMSALVNDVVAAGFCAIEVDRSGFADRAAALEVDLRRLLGAPVSTTPDDRLLAWNLGPAGAALTSQVGSKQVKATGDHVLHPVVVYTDRGTYNVEYDNQVPYQWTGPTSEIDVHNFGRTSIDSVRLTFSLAAPNSAPRRFTLHLPGGRTQHLDVNGGMAQEFQVFLKATPGRNALLITTTGAGESAPSDSSLSNVGKRIVFGKLINLQTRVDDPTIHIVVKQQRID